MGELAVDTPGRPVEQGRRVQSGPKERTKQLAEERGEGDGSETIPRPCSRRSHIQLVICSLATEGLTSSHL